MNPDANTTVPEVETGVDAARASDAQRVEASGSTEARSPRLIASLDAATLAAASVLVSNVVFGGFRLTFGDTHLAATAAWRSAIVVAVLAGIRHWWMSRPSLPALVAGAFRAAWRSPMRPIVLVSFLGSRAMVLVAGFLGVVLVGYPPNAPPYRVSSNEITNLPLRWDAGWYLQIAMHGYHFNRRASERIQQNVAFFPAYPYLSRIGGALLGARATQPDRADGTDKVEEQIYFPHRRVLAAALLISLGSFAWALVYLYRLARDMLDEDAAAGAVILASAYPFAYFFNAVYTEALFLLAALGAVYHLRRGELVRASIWGLAVGLTRPNGCVLSVALGILALQQARFFSWRPRAVVGYLTAAAMPVAGMLLFTLYLWQLTGRWFAWMEAHRAWGRVYQSVEALLIDRMHYIAAHGFYEYSTVQPIEVLNAVPVFAALLLTIPIARRLGLAYAALVVVMVLPPLAAGGFLSLGRLTATVFPIFMILGWLCRGSVRTGVAIAFAGLQGFLAVIFFTWRPLF